MPTNVMAMLQSLSRVQIERLLKAKECIEALQSRRDALRQELAQIEADLNGLLEGTGDVARTPRGVRKAKKKTTPRAKAARAAAAETPAAKKTTRKKTGKKAAKKTAKKTAKKAAAKPAKALRRKVAAAPAKAARGAGKRPTLEDVVANLIAKRGEPVAFQDLLATITGKKLFETKSANFDNVLRRTLSTSTRIKRVGRGMYGI